MTKRRTLIDQGTQRLEMWEYQKRLEMAPRTFYFRRRVNSVIIFTFLLLVTPMLVGSVGVPFTTGLVCECVMAVLSFFGIRYAWRQKAPDRTHRIQRLEEENARLDHTIDGI